MAFAFAQPKAAWEQEIREGRKGSGVVQYDTSCSRNASCDGSGSTEDAVLATTSCSGPLGRFLHQSKRTCLHIDASSTYCDTFSAKGQGPPVLDARDQSLRCEFRGVQSAEAVKHLTQRFHAEDRYDAMMQEICARPAVDAAGRDTVRMFTQDEATLSCRDWYAGLAIDDEMRTATEKAVCKNDGVIDTASLDTCDCTEATSFAKYLGGPLCNTPCSGHGAMGADGTCVCSSGWQGAHCEAADLPDHHPGNTPHPPSSGKRPVQVGLIVVCTIAAIVFVGFTCVVVRVFRPPNQGNAKSSRREDTPDVGNDDA